MSSAATQRVCSSEFTWEEIHGGVCKAESNGGIVILLQLHERQAATVVIISGRGALCPSSQGRSQGGAHRGHDPL
jgi:hypothetical protein